MPNEKSSRVLHPMNVGATLQHFVDRIRIIRERIHAAAEGVGRDPSRVQLLGASKLVPPERVRLAVEAGLTDLGENRVQEARDKRASLAELDSTVTWHLIGHLQSNKARQAVQHFDWIHSIDSIALANELEKRASAAEKQLLVLVEVNITGEATKKGVAPERLTETLQGLIGLEHLSVRGLMTMGKWSPDPEESRAAFRRLRELRDEMRERFPDFPLDQLSMGMSGDFEVAVEEGSTWVRIGTGIFGPRPAR